MGPFPEAAFFCARFPPRPNEKAAQISVLSHLLDALAEARHLKPGDSVNLDLRAIEVDDTDQDQLASQLAIGNRIMQRDHKILHALAQ